MRIDIMRVLQRNKVFIALVTLFVAVAMGAYGYYLNSTAEDMPLLQEDDLQRTIKDQALLHPEVQALLDEVARLERRLADTQAAKLRDPRTESDWTQQDALLTLKVVLPDYQNADESTVLSVLSMSLADAYMEYFNDVDSRVSLQLNATLLDYLLERHPDYSGVVFRDLIEAQRRSSDEVIVRIGGRDLEEATRIAQDVESFIKQSPIRSENLTLVHTVDITITEAEPRENAGEVINVGDEYDERILYLTERVETLDKEATDLALSKLETTIVEKSEVSIVRYAALGAVLGFTAATIIAGIRFLMRKRIEEPADLHGSERFKLVGRQTDGVSLTDALHASSLLAHEVATGSERVVYVDLGLVGEKNRASMLGALQGASDSAVPFVATTDPSDTAIDYKLLAQADAVLILVEFDATTFSALDDRLDMYGAMGYEQPGVFVVG